MKKILESIVKHRHWGLHAAIALILGTAFLDWMPIGEWPHRITDAVFLGTMVIAIFTQQLLHLSGPLCEDCIESMPLDAEGAVRRRKPLLKIVHLIADDRRGSLGYLLIICGLAGLSYAFDKRSVGQNLCGTAQAVLMSTVWYSMIVHNRLQPWCPWCHWGRGHDEQVEAPDPIVPEAV